MLRRAHDGSRVCQQGVARLANTHVQPEQPVNASNLGTPLATRAYTTADMKAVSWLLPGGALYTGGSWSVLLDPDVDYEDGTK
jgi:hypothetical protein